MPSRPPRRLVRQIGPDAAQALYETRGTGRRFSAYRDMLAGLVKAAYPARVAVVGAGEGVELAIVIKGLRSTANVKLAWRTLVCLARDAREEALTKDVQYRWKFCGEDNRMEATSKARVYNWDWPCHERVANLGARGDFWFSVVVVAPTRHPAWTIEAVETLLPIMSTDTLLIACRAHDSEQGRVVSALEGAGWAGGPWGEFALLWRRSVPAEG